MARTNRARTLVHILSAAALVAAVCVGGGCTCGTGSSSASGKPQAQASDRPAPQSSPRDAAAVVLRDATPEEAAANLKTEPPAPRPEDSVKSPTADPGWPKPTDKPVSTTRTPRGVVVEDYVLGEGMPVLPGGLVTVHFVARVKGGEMFQSTYGAGAPEEHRTREFMPGVAEGIIGMRKGGKRRLIIAPELAFGPQGVVSEEGRVIVPPDATVLFDIELVDLKQSLDLTPASEPKMQTLPAPK